MSATDLRALVTWLTSPSVRKALYRLAWVALVALVAQGKLTQEYADQLLLVAAALFGVADLNTGKAPSQDGGESAESASEGETEIEIDPVEADIDEI